MLNNIRIVLVAPTHPGNIGASARAMKTMGLQHLYLVNPKRFPDPQATDRATKATDILENAPAVTSLQEAIKDCNLVFGTSARLRELPWPECDLRTAAKQTMQQASNGKIAFVFGREHAGLTNEELELCHYQIHIPANPEYSSLNLASAVQIICYEIRMAYLAMEQQTNIEEDEWITVEELELFYQHLEKTLEYTEFIRPTASNQVMSRLRRLFSRTRIERRELNILRGILSSIEKTP